MKLFPKWKTVNTILDNRIKVQVGSVFTNYETECIVYVQTKEKVFSEGQWIRCLVKTHSLTDTMDVDLVLMGLGLDNFEELENYKPPKE